MNKHCYRVIFNKAKQCLVVVSELAKSARANTKTSCQSAVHFSPVFATLKILSFSVCCALGLVSLSGSALADTLIIKADPTAPKQQKPIMLSTANGLPQVNIQTPNDKGLSHNKYRQFDVSEKGAILNNSRKNTATQLAGQITANLYLAKGEAKVILNEVNSNKASQLKGYVEVAGKKAEVIIANPSGLYCEGCGFINTDKTTLTTGKPHIVNGELDHFVVEKGKVTVTGQGLDNSRVDYTDIIAKQSQINAGIWSKKKVNVVTGKNKVHYANPSQSDQPLQIISTKNTALSHDEQAQSPYYTVDVSQLGGMYAEKIYLVGTEQGLGVRNAGHIGASSENVQINAQGKVINTGYITAPDKVTVQSNQNIENTGRIETKQGKITLKSNQSIKQNGELIARNQQIQLTAKKQISQQGNTLAHDNVSYQAQQVNTTQNALIASGVNFVETDKGEQRTIAPQTAQGKNILIQASEKASLQGKHLAPNKITVTANQVELNHSQNSAYQIDIQAKTGDIQANHAKLTASETLSLSTPKHLSTQYAQLSAKHIQSNQANLNASHAIWQQSGEETFNLRGKQLNTAGAIFQSAGKIKLNADEINYRQGSWIAGKGIEVNTTGKVDGSQGQLLAKENIHIHSGEFINDQGLMYSESHIDIDTQSQRLSNQHTTGENQGIVALGGLRINSGTLDNQDGKLASRDNQLINTADINNAQGHIQTESALKVQGKNLNNDLGVIQSKKDLTIQARSLLNNQGNISTDKNMRLNIEDKIQQTQGLMHADNLRLQTNDLHNVEQSEISANTLNIQAKTLNNTKSKLVANHNANLQTQGGIENQQGIIASLLSELSIDSHQSDLNNHNGTVYANNLLLQTGALNNRNGLVQANSAEINTHQQKFDNQNTKTAQNNKGLIVNNLTLLTRELDNQNGNLMSQNLKGESALFNNQNGTVIVSENAEISNDKLTNQQGELLVKQDAKIKTKNLNNQQGIMVSTQGNLIAIANTVNNTEGTINARNTLLITSKTLSNHKGQLASHNILTLSTQAQPLDNQQGKISSANELTINTKQLNNQGGILGAKNAEITASQIQNNAVSDIGSLIYATENLTLNSTHIENQQTKTNVAIPTQGIQANSLYLNAHTVNNQQGGIYSNHQATLNIAESLVNQQGELLANNQLTISHGGNLMVNNQNGTIQATDITLNAKGLTDEGTIKTAGNLTINLVDSLALHRAFEVGKDLSLTTSGNFTNYVNLLSGNKATITAQNINNTKNAEISATETSLKTNNITNRGLINGDNTLINGTNLTNIGTGKIYGSHLAIQAKTLNNQAESIDNQTSSATIAARERLDLGVDTLINKDSSFIFSSGDGYIGQTLDQNNHAVGVANLIKNESATIEFLGNGTINAKEIKNQDTKVNIRIREEQEQFDLYGKEDRQTYKVTEWYRIGVDGTFDPNNGQRHKSATFYFYDTNKEKIDSSKGDFWQRKVFTRTSYIPEVHDEAPAKILIGGSLHLNSDYTLNQYSQLLVGKQFYFNQQEVDAPSHQINHQGLLINEDLTATLNMKDDGFFIRYYQDRYKTSWHEHRRYFLDEKIKESVPQPLPKKVSFNLVLNTIGSAVPTSNITVQSVNKQEKVALSPIANISQDIPNITSVSVNITEHKNDIVHSGQVIVQLPEKIAISNATDHSALPVIKTHLVNVTLPTASLYQINPTAPKGYVVETDPKFTDRNQWLSSDYMFNQLRYDHSKTQKRLGDGYYEQRLINEQINQLTGRRYLTGFNNDMEQYKALMNAGVKYAKDFNLSVGVGLTAKQMSELTTDMVWLVNKEVTLKNGEKITALVPQVYLVASDADIDSRGAVISANNILANVDELQNTGTIAGRDLTHIQSNHLKNQGVILGDSVDLSANQTLINLGGKIEAASNLTLYAGKTLELASTTNSAESTNPNFARTELDQLSQVKVTGKGGQLNLLSDGNITVKASQLESNGSLYANAKNGLTITTLNTVNKEHYNADDNNYYRLDQQGEIGSSLQAKDNLTLIGKQQVDIRQAEINSEQGNVVIGSQGEVNIHAGKQQEQVASAVKSSHKGLLSKTTEIKRHYHNISQVESSDISGENVSIFSENKSVNINGSNVVANQSLQIQAKNGVNITADSNRYYEENYHQKTKSGLMSSGGIGFTVGKKQEDVDTDNTQYSAVGSQVGSLHGNTQIITDGSYQQSGSIVTSKDGDVLIMAKNANITGVESDYESNYKYQMKQSGLTVAVNIPALLALQSAISTVKSIKTVGQSKDNRINALAAANVGFGAVRTYEQGKDLYKNLQENGMDGLKQDISVSITYGKQKNTQTQHAEGNKVEKSQVNAGGEVNIVTTGKNENLVIIGSDVSGNQGTHLQSNGNINILAANENHLERSKNKASGWNAGVAVSYGQSGFSFGVTAGGKIAKGYGNGDSKAWVNSYVGSQNSQTTIDSQKDTNIKSSQVAGKQITVNAENLNIESLQDTATYKGKQESASGQVTVGYGVSASASYSQSKINSNYASVNQQAGIFAGDDGFKVNVANHTNLTGALITSTESAEENSRNSFSTGALSYSDIENHADYKGSAFGVSGSVAMNFDTPFGSKGTPQSKKQAVNEKGEKLYTDASGKETTEAKTNGKKNDAVLAKGWDSLTGDISFGVGMDKDNQSSVTNSGIGTSNIAITDTEKQKELTSYTAEEIMEKIKTTVRTDNAQQSSGKLENKFNKDKVLNEIQYQVKQTAEFTNNAQEMADNVIDYYQEPKRKELRQAILDYQNAKIDDKEKYQEKIDEAIKDIYWLEHLRTGLNLATGVVTGAPKVMTAKSLLATLNIEARRETLKNSLLAPPIEDKNGMLSNVAYGSGAFDGIKLGGVRMDYGIICGEGNSRCETNSDGSLKVNERGNYVFKENNKYSSLTDLFNDKPVTEKLYGITGGHQGIAGTMFGIPYSIGSVFDKAVEYYAGIHDLNGQVFFYDKQGNGHYTSQVEQNRANRVAVYAVGYVTPIVAGQALPNEVFELLFGFR
ncbi:two-partner secretion domain-containing protein [Lonepinella sp. BR2357]|uniref:two-partner secretion domain-containing protein n=1 Tax=Lonepinella sp. BR2357 TaxID=3434549 RepID=UPI003F6E1CE6